MRLPCKQAAQAPCPRSRLLHISPLAAAMFGKRLRKEEPADAAATCRREASAVAAAAGSLLLATPSCSIELATPSSSISALPRTLSSSGTPLDVGVVGLPPRPVERGTVRSKAAYFEALCRANTTLHIEVRATGLSTAAANSLHKQCLTANNAVGFLLFAVLSRGRTAQLPPSHPRRRQ